VRQHQLICGPGIASVDIEQDVRLMSVEGPQSDIPPMLKSLPHSFGLRSRSHEGIRCAPGETLRSNLPLLLYLAFITALLGLFALTFYRLTRATVLPNPGLSGYGAPRPENFFLRKPDSSVETMEHAAIDAAQAENEEEGIEPLQAFAFAEPAPTISRQLDGAALPRLKQAKQKAVAKTVANRWHASRNSPGISWARERRWNGRYEAKRGRSLWAYRDGFSQ